MCAYIFFFWTDTSIYGEKGTLSAQRDCRSEWTLLRSEKQAHRDKTTICELTGKSHSLKFSRSCWPYDLYWLMDSQKEHSCIMNISVLGWSVTGSGPRPYLRASSCFLSLSPAEPSCGRRLESLRQFAAFPMSCVCHSCHIHSLSQVLCVCVCALTPHSGCLFNTHMYTHPLGCWAAGNLDGRWSLSWVSVLSWWDDRAVTHVWMTCRLWKWRQASNDEPRAFFNPRIPH